MKKEVQKSEVYEYGPLRIERNGRFLNIRSNWDPVQHKKYIATLKDNRPELKQQIDSLIEEVRTILQSYNPLEILEVVTLKNGFADPETYTEIKHEGHEKFIEYTLSLALTREFPETTSELTTEVAEGFLQKLDDIFNFIHNYYATDNIETRNLDSEIKFDQLITYLGIRGDTYPELHEESAKDIFRKHNSVIKDNCGFTVDDFFSAVTEIEKQIKQNLITFKEMMDINMLISNEFAEYLKHNSIALEDVDSSIKKEFENRSPNKNKIQQFYELAQNYKENPFIIIPNDNLSEDFLKFFSTSFGTNVQFIEYKPAICWPAGNSIVYDKPIIYHNDSYYCFGTQILFRNTIDIFEKIISEQDNTYYLDTFQKARGSWLEIKSIEYLEKLLPGCKTYRSLYYTVFENGEEKRVETDGIILFDKCIFIVEAKAGQYSKFAKRGGIKSLKEELGELVNEAYKQGKRTKQYIESNEKPRFEDEHGNVILEISNKSLFDQLFIINTTIENISQLVSNLSMLKSFEIIDGEFWPWSVYINDLRVISEVIDSPSLFILFLERRLKVNNYPYYRAKDELDLMMVFLKEGLYLESDNKEKLNFYTPLGYTETLDRYYDFLAGRVKSGTKPSFFSNQFLKSLVQNIESTGKNEKTEIGSFLYSLDKKIQDDISKRLKINIKDTAERHINHDTTFCLQEHNIGISIFTNYSDSQTERDRISSYVYLQMYRFHIEKWYAVLLVINNEGIKYTDIKTFHKPWAHDSDLDKLVEGHVAHVKNAINNLVSKSSNRDRNRPCPCGSGKKYKKCCQYKELSSFV